MELLCLVEILKYVMSQVQQRREEDSKKEAERYERWLRFMQDEKASRDKDRRMDHLGKLFPLMGYEPAWALAFAGTNEPCPAPLSGQAGPSHQNI